MKRQTAKAVYAIVAMLAFVNAIYGGDEGPPLGLACPDCGGPAWWEECELCKGTGLIHCFCEGAGGRTVCAEDCC